MGKAKKRAEALGMLDPARLYSASGLLRHAGIGEEKRSEMRRSGMVKPIDVGTYRWYRGEEVIAWIVAQAK